MWQAHAHAIKGRKREMIPTKKRFRIKRELSAENPTVRVGKNGATEKVIEEIARQLKKREMVKMRILKSALANQKVQAVASGIAQQTGAELIDVRGHTVMLYKRRAGS